MSAAALIDKMLDLANVLDDADERVDRKDVIRALRDGAEELALAIGWQRRACETLAECNPRGVFLAREIAVLVKEATR
jgi:hypothetical protein